MKACTQCKETKGLESFHKMSSTKDGRRPNCKVCHLAKDKQYRTENRDKYLARRRANTDANRDTINASRRQWRLDNLDRETERNAVWRSNNEEALRLSKQKYYNANRDVILAKSAEYYSDNKEDLNEKGRIRHKSYYLNNKAYYIAKDARRRAIKLQASPVWADKEAIERMYKISHFLTNKLGEPHHVDHIIPLQHKDVCGLHVEYNLDVISAHQNLSKGNEFNTGVSL